MVGDWPNDRLWPLWAMLRDTAPELIRVGREAGVEDLAITGSVARGVDHNASDFDFWLPTVERGRLDKYTDQEALKSEFSRVLGRSVDIRPLVPNVDDPIYSESMRMDAIPLEEIAARRAIRPNALASLPRRVTVMRPKPDGPSSTRSVTGIVTLHENGEQVGWLSFGHKRGSRLVCSTQFTTEPGHYRSGVATVMVRELMRSYRGCEIAYSGVASTPQGEGLLVGLRLKGIPIHDGLCFQGGDECVCGLEQSLPK